MIPANELPVDFQITNLSLVVISSLTDTIFKFSQVSTVLLPGADREAKGLGGHH